MTEQWENLSRLSPLLPWYDAHGRALPWREDPTPYHTWLSEIMLQQTRVAAVLPYYERFLRELPDIPSLAAVSEERLGKLWEGLGYYSRARNLRRAAQIVTEDYGGALPSELAALQSLPGIGDYTAAAIASICFGAPEPAVDGNLLRVTARLCGCAENIGDARVKRAMRSRLAAVIDRTRPGAWNQAMMDLGAMVCLPGGAPRCADCPLRASCAAYREGLTGVLPVREKKKPRRGEEHTVFLLLRGGKIAVRRRSENGLLAGLTEFPNAPGSLDEASARLILARWGLETERLEPGPAARHIFTHVEWQLKGYIAAVHGEGAALRWVDAAELEALPIPSAFRAYTAAARGLLGSGAGAQRLRGASAREDKAK